MSVTGVKWTLPDYGAPPWDGVGGRTMVRSSGTSLSPSRRNSAVAFRVRLSVVYLLMLATSVMALLDLVLLLDFRP